MSANKQIAAAAFFAVALAVVAWLGITQPALPPSGDQLVPLGTTHFSGPLDITGGGSASAPALYLAGDSDTGLYQSAANNLDVAAAGSRVLNLSSSGVSVTGDVVASAFGRHAAATSITVTNGSAFTPTGTYQPVVAASEVTPTVATGGATAGDVVVLINTGSSTINLADSGTAKLSAAWAAGQYDALVLWFDGTNWIEISRSDN